MLLKMSLWLIDFFSSAPLRIWELLTELEPILSARKSLSELDLETTEVGS
jgi:hypothetical protein